MGVSVARAIAFETLRRVEAEGAYASDLLHAELGADVKTEDAALATELTLGVLRRRRLLDFLLERHLKKPIGRLDLPVILALRMGLYQLRYLERIPARAAVDESVELTKRARKGSAASLVNAVLRRMAGGAEEPAEKLLPARASRAEQLGILHSHPTWIVERWLGRLGETGTIALLEANNRAPRLSCAVHTSDRREGIIRAMERAGMHVEPGSLLKSALNVSGGSPARTEAFRKGWISILDEASQTVPLLLGVQAGERVLDVCAAPGGKTTSLARAAGDKGFVVAADRQAHRLRAMRAQFVRLGVERIPLVELDASKPLPFRREFRRILVDAPCSGTGTLARHPEIRWRLQPEQLAQLHDLQIQMLVASLAQLVRGGRLVYSTCSLEPEENEEVVARGLERIPSRRRVAASEAVRTLAGELADGVDGTKLFDSEGYFRTSPARCPTDGFFAALLERE